MAHPRSIVSIVDFAENLFRVVKTKDMAGRRPYEEGFNPYLELYPHQKKILEWMFTPNEDGVLPAKTYIWSCPKKSGKTMMNALVCGWFMFVLLPFWQMEDEIIIAANSKDHAAGRVFKALRYAILNEPLLRAECLDREIGNWKIKTKKGIECQAVASEAGTVAGASFSLVSFDELWAYTTEGERQLYEELTPIPTKDNSCRFISTYAGVPGKSNELEELWKKAVKNGECVDKELQLYRHDKAKIYAYWDEVPRLPWHTPEYLEEQRASLRPFAYQRLWQNQWTAGDDGLDMDEWDACVKEGDRLGWTRTEAQKPNQNLYLTVGVDASIVKDRSAVVTCFRKQIQDPNNPDRMIEKVFLGPRMVWNPTEDDPMDFEDTIEKFILELQQNYTLGPVFYDPYQFVRSAQVLWKQGVYMVEYTQSVPNGIKMTQHLTDLMRLNNLVLYEDEELRKEAVSVSLKEHLGKGYRITKDTANKKIDSIVALAMAALAAEKCMSSDDTFSDAVTILPFTANV